MGGKTQQQKTTHKGRKNIQLQDLQIQEGGIEYVWNISEQIQGTTGHHGAKTKGCQRHGFYMCGVVQHAEETSGWGRQATNPANDVAALQNEQVVYVPNDNYRILGGGQT